MITVSVSYRSPRRNQKEGNIRYLISLKGSGHFSYINTKLRILPSDWDKLRHTVIVRKRSIRADYLTEVSKRICDDVKRITRVIKQLENQYFNVSPSTVAVEAYNYLEELDIENYMKEQIEVLKENGHMSTAANYSATLNNLKRYLEGRTLMIDSVDIKFIESYRSWLLTTGIMPNTISFYLRIVRAVYNRAVDDGLIENQFPFRRAHIGSVPTAKRAISISKIRKIKSLDLSPFPEVEFSRDMFILSFYFRGMNLIDLAHLKKTDLKDNRITYKRHKTGQLLSIKWTSEMQSMIKKYARRDSPFLLPLFSDESKTSSVDFKKISNRINYNLKKIGRIAGIKIALTFYVARHSWATAAKTIQIPITIISEAMGHTAESTTQIYLASINPIKVDKANAKVIRTVS